MFVFGFKKKKKIWPTPLDNIRKPTWAKNKTKLRPIIIMVPFKKEKQAQSKHTKKKKP